MGKQFDPNALLYSWNFREEDGLPRLIGTNPELADRSQFFRWINEPGGWERHEPWPQGATNVQALDNSAGLASGWPGATPLRGKPGRPRKDPVPENDRTVALSISVRRADVIDIQRRASNANKTVSEWLVGIVHDALKAP